MAKVNAREVLREVQAHVDEYNDEFMFAMRSGDHDSQELAGGKAGATNEILDMLETTLRKEGKITTSSKVLDDIRALIKENDEVSKFHEFHGAYPTAKFYIGKREAGKEILERLEETLKGGEIVASVEKSVKNSLKPKGKPGKTAENDITDGM